MSDFTVIREALDDIGHEGAQESIHHPDARAALSRVETELAEAKTRWNRRENHAAGMLTQLSNMRLARAVAAEQERDAKEMELRTAWRERDDLRAFKNEALATDWISRAEAAEAERDEARKSLEAIAAQQPKTLEMIRHNGFVFDDIGREPGNWQHLAFSVYTDLCEVDSIARAALADKEEG